jgi:hypothetical protein
MQVLSVNQTYHEIIIREVKLCLESQNSKQFLKIVNVRSPIKLFQDFMAPKIILVTGKSICVLEGSLVNNCTFPSSLFFTIH